jgi:hypothetical protein
MIHSLQDARVQIAEIAGDQECGNLASPVGQ